MLLLERCLLRLHPLQGFMAAPSSPQWLSAARKLRRSPGHPMMSFGIFKTCFMSFLNHTRVHTPTYIYIHIHTLYVYMYIHNCKCIYTTVYAYSVKGSFKGILHSGRTFWQKTLGNMYMQIIYIYIYTRINIGA